MQKIKNWITGHKKTTALLVLIVLGVVYGVTSGGNKKTDLYTIKKMNVTQKVIVNGNTKAINDSSLAFEVNGTVSRANVAVGSRVTVGQALVSLDSGTLSADLLKAKANVETEKARLEELKKGAKPEEIAVAETEVANAKITLGDAEANLQNKVVDIITNTIDQFFSNPRTINPQFNLVVNNNQLKNDINNARAEIESIVNNWNSFDIDKNLPKIIALVDNVAIAVNSQTAVSGLTQTTIDSYKSSVSTAKSSLVTAKETLNTSRARLTLADKNLTLKKSGSSPEVIKAQEARVLQNEAQVASVEAQLSKMTLRSPQNGIVTKQDAKVGEIVTPGKVVVSVISDSDLEIESNVSEVSIGKVSVGNHVIIAFDAFPNQEFHGAVSYIEPGETIVDGVVNYKITVAFAEKYPQIKSGLTSRLDIITGEKKDVLAVPEYSIIKKDAGTFISKQNGKEFVEIPVTVGLRGQDGFVEIVSGINEGDVVQTVAPVE